MARHSFSHLTGCPLATLQGRRGPLLTRILRHVPSAVHLTPIHLVVIYQMAYELVSVVALMFDRKETVPVLSSAAALCGVLMK